MPTTGGGFAVGSAISEASGVPITAYCAGGKGGGGAGMNVGFAEGSAWNWLPYAPDMFPLPDAGFDAR